MHGSGLMGTSMKLMDARERFSRALPRLVGVPLGFVGLSMKLTGASMKAHG
jgi:hypothetical protein